MKPVRVSILAELILGSAGVHAEETRSRVGRAFIRSPVAILRIMIQQSNCFQAVERGAASKVNGQTSTKAGVPLSAGASVYARLATVKVYTGPRANSKVMGALKRSEEAIATGAERDGFVKIDGEYVSGGWVQRTLVAPQKAQ